MSKYKGSNYGGGVNSRANAAAASASSSSSSPSTIESLSSLVDLLDSYGFDLPAMLLLFWLLLFFLVVGGVNLYLALVRRRQQQQQKLADQKQKVNSASSDQRRPESEALLRSSVAANSCQSSPPPKRKPNYALEEDEEGRRWIAKVIDWLYNRGNLGAGGGEVSQSVEAWLTALNAKSAQLTAENGIHVEFVRLYREKSSSIHFTDVKVESEVNGNLLTTLKAICDRLVIAVRVHHSSRDLSATVGQHQHHQHQQHSSALYEIELNKFSALLKVVCKPEDSLFIVRCLERPETKVHINGPLTSSEQNSFSPDLIINGVINVLTSTLVDLSFANADRFPAFPARHTSSSTFSRRTFDGSAEIGNGSSVSGGRQRSLERKLFVTIARAHNLPVNQSKEGHEVYCTIEMNEPRERRQTSSIRGPDASAPVWQDHFLFALNEQSREIHFEVFDGFQEKTGRTASASASSSSTADVSLGTGVANLLELKLNPSEKLTIPLQSRRSNGYQGSGGSGGGSLEVELLLMEHKLPNGGDSADEHQALNLPEKSEYSKMPAELAAYYRDLSSTANSTSSHLDQYARSSLNTIKSDDHAHSSEGYGTDRGVTPSDVPSSSGTLPPTRPESRSSQPPRERSLIRTIRKRLSFTKRSKSVERSGPGTGSFRESSVGAGSSSGLNGNGTGSSALDRDERARSVPGSREPSAPRDNMANGKKQESFLSLASNTSFFAENSTLVLECTVNGEKKHYIVPYSKANKRKYRRRKGVKLHVFNDHLFVAQHVSSSQECAVCAKTFPMRIGKQGYVCRECGFLTHKLCHVNAESYCPANGAARLNFEVEGGGVNGGDSDTPRQMPSPVPEVRVIAPTEPFNEKEVF